jgi:hypothetical protein
MWLSAEGERLSKLDGLTTYCSGSDRKLAMCFIKASSFSYFLFLDSTYPLGCSVISSPKIWRSGANVSGGLLPFELPDMFESWMGN